MKTESEIFTPKTIRRFAELNAASDLAQPGVAEDYLMGILNQIIEGDFEVVTQGWEFDQGEIWARKPLHELRKELGALVTQEHGIYAASRVLRHADVATTARHYTDLKSRPVVNVGEWIAPENVAEFPVQRKPAPQSSRMEPEKRGRQQEAKV